MDDDFGSAWALYRQTPQGLEIPPGPHQGYATQAEAEAAATRRHDGPWEVEEVAFGPNRLAEIRQGASDVAYRLATETYDDVVLDAGTSDPQGVADYLAALEGPTTAPAARAGALAGLRGDPPPTFC